MVQVVETCSDVSPRDSFIVLQGQRDMKQDMTMPKHESGPWREQWNHMGKPTYWRPDSNINTSGELQMQHIEDRRITDLDSPDEDEGSDDDVDIKREDSGTPTAYDHSSYCLYRSF